MFPLDKITLRTLPFAMHWSKVNLINLWALHSRRTNPYS